MFSEEIGSTRGKRRPTPPTTIGFAHCFVGFSCSVCCLNPSRGIAVSVDDTDCWAVSVRLKKGSPADRAGRSRGPPPIKQRRLPSQQRCCRAGPRSPPGGGGRRKAGGRGRPVPPLPLGGPKRKGRRADDDPDELILTGGSPWPWRQGRDCLRYLLVANACPLSNFKYLFNSLFRVLFIVPSRYVVRYRFPACIFSFG